MAKERIKILDNQIAQMNEALKTGPGNLKLLIPWPCIPP
jgi:hypothetical protein